MLLQSNWIAIELSVQDRPTQPNRARRPKTTDVNEDGTKWQIEDQLCRSERFAESKGTSRLNAVESSIYISLSDEYFQPVLMMVLGRHPILAITEEV